MREIRLCELHRFDEAISLLRASFFCHRRNRRHGPGAGQRQEPSASFRIHILGPWLARPASAAILPCRSIRSIANTGCPPARTAQGRRGRLSRRVAKSSTRLHARWRGNPHRRFLARLRDSRETAAILSSGFFNGFPRRCRRNVSGYIRPPVYTPCRCCATMMPAAPKPGDGNKERAAIVQCSGRANALFTTARW